MNRFTLAAVSALAMITAAPASAATLTTLATFNRTNGGGPTGSLTIDAAGNLYGTTSLGGRSRGTVFKLSANGGTLTTLANFTGPNGASPYGDLTIDAAGNLYGTTSGTSGRGTVFRLGANGGALTTLATFTGGNGANPLGSLTFDAAGNLYGTTSRGGSTDNGTVFKLDGISGTLSTFATFTGENGASPRGSLTFDTAGNLYGTTLRGGAQDLGAVFKVGADGGARTSFITFDGKGNGANPYGSLTVDAAGNLYGTTSGGGANGWGTVFKLDGISGVLTTLATFNGANGANPVGSLTFDAAGNLYGTTLGNNTNNVGTVFKLGADGGALTTLASFTGGNGASPYGSLTFDAAGNLYGTTFGGGNTGNGTVFKLSDTGFVVPAVAAVPEPATWGLMLVGFGLVGAAMRTRRRSTTVTYA